MGPTGQPDRDRRGARRCSSAGGGLGNAVLFSIARAFKATAAGCSTSPATSAGEDLFKRDDIERWTDQVIWCTDAARHRAAPAAGPHFRGNIVQAMQAYGDGRARRTAAIPLARSQRIIAIGSDRMMAAVREARHGVLAPLLDPQAPGHRQHQLADAVHDEGGLRAVPAEHVDPQTGKERVVFTCFNQDQELDAVDFRNLRERLRANSMQEKLADAWLDELLKAATRRSSASERRHGRAVASTASCGASGARGGASSHGRRESWFVARCAPPVVGARRLRARRATRRRASRDNLRRVRGRARARCATRVDVARDLRHYASCLAEVLGAGSRTAALPDVRRARRAARRLTRIADARGRHPGHGPHGGLGERGPAARRATWACA